VRSPVKANLNLVFNNIYIGWHIRQIPEDMASISIGVSTHAPDQEANKAADFLPSPRKWRSQVHGFPRISHIVQYRWRGLIESTRLRLIFSSNRHLSFMRLFYCATFIWHFVWHINEMWH